VASYQRLCGFRCAACHWIHVNRLIRAQPTPEAQFYAHLYAGLYFEGTGNRDRAQPEITTAAGHYTAGGYMHDVAVVHRDILLQTDQPAM
jgi:hypothetical protein